MAKVERERDEVRQKLEADFMNDRRAALKHENEMLVEAVPEWQDKELALKEKTKLAEYAIGMGFEKENVDQLIDHRLVLLLRKAAAFDSMDETREVVKEKVKKKAKTLKPGQPRRKPSSARKKTRAAKAQRDKLRKSGHVDDAAAFIFDNLDDL